MLGAFLLYFNGFSGQPIFAYLIYPTIDTIMVIFGPAGYAIFDKHLSEHDLLHRPYLYKIVSFRMLI